MGRRLPPLNAIRAFEAAARHLSFTRAAEELNVTQAAISHQIKGLEDVLGIPLFRRLNRALMLTEAGQTYLPPLREALDQIADATARLKTADSGGALTISTLASFAAKWLVPRLPRFQERHPEIDVLISTTAQMVDFAQQDVDAAIRFGRGGWEGVRADRLLTEDIFPVCAPSLLEGSKPLLKPDDLSGFTLLHDDFLYGWTMWLQAVGAQGVDAARGTRFTDFGAGASGGDGGARGGAGAPGAGGGRSGCRQAGIAVRHQPAERACLLLRGAAPLLRAAQGRGFLPLGLRRGARLPGSRRAGAACQRAGAIPITGGS